MEKQTQKGSRTPWRAHAMLGMLVALAVGCPHTPRPIPPQPIEAYAFRETRSGVHVAVDPYYTIDRLKLTFTGGEDFPRNGLLPVRVIIENGSGGEIQVSPQNFRLVRSDGSSDLPLSVQDAASAVKVPMGWWVIGVPVGAGAIPAMQTDNRQRSLEARALKEAKIPATESASGFVYFYLPETEKSLAGIQIAFALSGSAVKELSFAVPIDGRREFATPEARPVEQLGPPPPVVQTPVDPQNPRSPTRIQGTDGGVIIRSPPR